MGRKFRIENSIEYKRPWMLAEWNYCINPDPSTVRASSSEYFSWTCMFCGNSWEAKANCHTKPGCSECRKKMISRRRSIPKPGQSLADIYPELVKSEWDYNENTKSPKCIFPHARYYAHWICSECGFPYQAWVYNRTCQGSGCPECKKKKVGLANSTPGEGESLQEVAPELAKEWHPTKNGDLTPSDVYANSGIPVWWLGDCGHEYDMDPCHRMQGNGCPFCAGKRVLVGFNDLQTNYPEIASEWDENDPSGLTPTTVTQFSGKELQFICDTHGPYKKKVITRTLLGEGCPECAKEKRNQRIALVGQNFKKTHDQFVEEVAEKNPTMKILGKYVDAKHPVKSICTKCNTVAMRFPGNLLHGGCVTCMQEDMRMSEDEFKKRLARANPDVKLVGEYTMASEKALFKCVKCGYRWRTVGTSVLRGSGCSKCCNGMGASIPEKAVYYYVSRHFRGVKENAHPDIPGLGRKEIDIWIPSINTALEYDGSAWHKDTDKDLKKDTILHEAGARMIRIREPRCPVYETTADLVFRDDETTNASLEKVIREVLNMLGVDGDNCDIDIDRDMYIFKQLKETARCDLSSAPASVTQMRLPI